MVVVVVAPGSHGRGGKMKIFSALALLKSSARLTPKIMGPLFLASVVLSHRYKK
jgi:hypothetical protein